MSHPATLLVTLTSDDLRALLLECVTEALGGTLPGAEPPREIMSRAEASDFLRCSVATLDRLARDGEITPRRVGDSPRYLRSELLAYVAGSSVSAPTLRAVR